MWNQPSAIGPGPISTGTDRTAPTQTIPVEAALSFKGYSYKDGQPAPLRGGLERLAISPPPPPPPPSPPPPPDWRD